MAASEGKARRGYHVTPAPPGLLRRVRSLWIVVAALAVVVVACVPLKSPSPPPPPPPPTVYLTFDDGPSVYTAQILAVLERKGVHAEFYIVGEHATQYPSYVQQENADGDLVADHTWDHPDLTTLPPEQIRGELESTAVEIENLTGKRTTLWRSPYSLRNATVNEIASSLGLTHRGANFNTHDYQQPGTDAIVSAVLDNVHDGTVVLLHDGGGDRSQTVAAVPTIIDKLRERGYKFGMLATSAGSAGPDALDGGE